ncbi:hypothetical protein ACHWQZ_G018391 [Mnemiopsis leidyi]
MDNSIYNEHVQFPMSVDPHELRVRVPDILLGVVLALCTLVGVPGNIVALRYFSTCAAKKKKIHVTTYIYMAIAAVDIFIGILQLPIMVVLFVARKPWLFNDHVFCVFWANVFEFLQRSSIFLAMLLSITRTIPIVVPLYKMKKFWILIGFLVYSLIIVLEPVIAMWNKIDYTYIYNLSDPNCFQMAVKGLARELQYFFEATNILVASIITFISFIVTIVKLCSAPQMSPKTKSGKSASRFRQASITVAMFTAVFLLCNLPMFVLVFLFFLSDFKYFGSFFMRYYPWMIAKVVFVVLNGALNPMLYFFRMKEFNSWVKNAGKVTPAGRTSSVISPDSRMS